MTSRAPEPEPGGSAEPGPAAEPDPAYDDRDDAYVDDYGEPVPGRPVVLVPTPPGMWALLGGIGVAALAPLFGFLIGGAAGAGDPGARFDPMAVGLFIGILVGGLGVVVAVWGGIRLWRHYHRQDLADEAQGIPAGARDADG